MLGGFVGSVWLVGSGAQLSEFPDHDAGPGTASYLPSEARAEEPEVSVEKLKHRIERDMFVCEREMVVVSFKALRRRREREREGVLLVL